MNQPESMPHLVVHWRDSLRTRLMLWFGALVAGLLALGFGVSYFAAQRQLLAEAEVRTRFEARQASERLAAAMISVRITGDGLVGLFHRLGLEREGLVQALEAMVEADGNAVGGLVALEPGVLADGAPMAYYAGVEARGVADRDLTPTTTTTAARLGTSARWPRRGRGGRSPTSMRPRAGSGWSRSTCRCAHQAARPRAW